jgi:hypothetical protein
MSDVRVRGTAAELPLRHRVATWFAWASAGTLVAGFLLSWAVAARAPEPAAVPPLEELPVPAVASAVAE